MKFAFFANAGIIATTVFSSTCFANNLNDSDISDYPDRIVSLVYLLRGDLYFSTRHESKINQEKFDEILNLMSEEEQKEGNFDLEGMLATSHHLCHVEMLNDFFCGLPTLLENDEGAYLFITDPMSTVVGSYIVLVYSDTAPEHTIILRISKKHAEIIYDSFRRENNCSMKPALSALRIVHLVKVTPKLEMELVEDSYHHSAANLDDPPRNFLLKFDSTTCALTQITNSK